jgi:DNA-binding Xre family transcriptional regulator
LSVRWNQEVLINNNKTVDFLNHSNILGFMKINTKEILKQVMFDKNLSVKQLAEIYGCSVQFMNKCLKEGVSTLSTLDKISNILDMTTLEFVTYLNKGDIPQSPDIIQKLDTSEPGLFVIKFDRRLASDEYNVITFRLNEAIKRYSPDSSILVISG